MPRFASANVQRPRSIKSQVSSRWLRTLLVTAVARSMDVIVTLMILSVHVQHMVMHTQDSCLYKQYLQPAEQEYAV